LQNGRIAGFEMVGWWMGGLTGDLFWNNSCTIIVVNQKAEELKARTRRFLLNVIALVKEFPKSASNVFAKRGWNSARSSIARTSPPETDRRHATEP